MKELGVKVLNKIQNLISVIEKKPGNNPERSNNKYGKKQSDSLHQKIDNQEYLKNLSYSYLQKQLKTSAKLKQDVYKEEAMCEHFRITNKQTKAILGKKNLRPIYERLDQIIGKKNSKIQELERKKIAKQHQQMGSINPSLDDLSSNNKSRYLQLEQYRQQVDEKNHDRIKKLHLLQLQTVKKQHYNGIPSISNSSRSLSKIYGQKKKLSQNVFKRLGQDHIDRNRRKEELMKQRQKEEGGFSPNLCERSRVLAEQARTKKPQFHLNQLRDSESHLKCKKTNVTQHFSISHRKSLSYINPQKQATPNKIDQSNIKKVEKQNLPKYHINQTQKTKRMKSSLMQFQKKQSLEKKQKSFDKNKKKQAVAQTEKQHAGTKSRKVNETARKQPLLKSKLQHSIDHF